MSISRIYQASPLNKDQSIVLSDEASHHLARVLRAKVGEKIILFNGEGGEYDAVITAIDKKSVTAKMGEHRARDRESSLQLQLAQGISRGEKMDFTIQKAVELGVHKIFPLFTERCNVKLDDERKQKRLQHWNSIIISACEQSGRNTIPNILPAQNFSQWLATVKADHCFILSPKSQHKLKEVSLKSNATVVLLIGPEGGLSDTELNLAIQKGFIPLSLGPRVLRTETAAIAALTALQCSYGDMA